MEKGQSGAGGSGSGSKSAGKITVRRIHRHELYLRLTADPRAVGVSQFTRKSAYDSDDSF